MRMGPLGPMALPTVRTGGVSVVPCVGRVVLTNAIITLIIRLMSTLEMAGPAVLANGTFTPVKLDVTSPITF